MKFKYLLTLILAVTFSIQLNASTKVEITTDDNVIVTGDLYSSDKNIGVILLCHQAESSRGEYIEIAKKLSELGYTCLAIDQRSGDKMNDVINETRKSAVNTLRTDRFTYLDAEIDIRAALDFLYSEYNQPVTLFGSSYSASLALKIANSNDQVKAVVAFSPGEYFGKEYNLLVDIKQVNVPIFITSARSEANNAEVIAFSVPNERVTWYIPNGEGKHGASALWASCEEHMDYWEALETFLSSFE